MAESRDVLVFSKRFVGGVRILAEMLRELDLRPVLVSAEPEDINRDACDVHLVVDWDGGEFGDWSRRPRLPMSGRPRWSTWWNR